MKKTKCFEYDANLSGFFFGGKKRKDDDVDDVDDSKIDDADAKTTQNVVKPTPVAFSNDVKAGNL
jgi:hypothetical protein